MLGIKEIFEKVSLKMPLEQRRFLNYFNDTIAELESLYPHKFLFEDGKDYTPIEDLSDEYVVLPLYSTAIVDNIIFLTGYDKDGTYKTEFLRKAENAYKKYWNDVSHNRHMKRMRW